MAQHLNQLSGTSSHLYRVTLAAIRQCSLSAACHFSSGQHPSILQSSFSLFLCHAVQPVFPSEDFRVMIVVHVTFQCFWYYCCPRLTCSCYHDDFSSLDKIIKIMNASAHAFIIILNVGPDYPLVSFSVWMGFLWGLQVPLTPNAIKRVRVKVDQRVWLS